MTNSDLMDLDRFLLPDEESWGQGYGDRGYTPGELDEIARNVAGTVQPGYGSRLHASSPGYRPGTPDSRATIPPGFDVDGHPNRAAVYPGTVDPDIATATTLPQQIDPGLQDYCRARGWVLDQHGRPLHPHHEQLLADARIGLCTGLGYGWWYGETVVADAVVTTPAGRVLIVPRSTDAGTIPSLPGGYAIPADVGRTAAQWRVGYRPVTLDGIVTTAARKAEAETGLVIPREVAARLVRGIRPVSSPHTLHAWTVTYTVRVQLPAQGLPALDETTQARWVDVDELYDAVLERMWPDHQRAVAAAIE
ncbi:NUDIX hydrolase [Amycolatopsis sp. ATCC 39116]|uniref:NUDIX hydrolase n=1 Tax=Amycolatopsis sp. (strain ATCC 39116 / 75iv2) TaxID=385957 RepID=UPI0002625D06|nr:NUDIX hydrolase [Amycolatopsis sp. ATCC 39116]